MYIFWMILYSLAISGLEIIMFFKVDGISLTFDRIFKAFLLKFLLIHLQTLQCFPSFFGCVNVLFE